MRVPTALIRRGTRTSEARDPVWTPVAVAQRPSPGTWNPQRETRLQRLYTDALLYPPDVRDIH